MITNERKKDIEETSDYIKTMVQCVKKELSHELLKINEDTKKIRMS